MIDRQAYIDDYGLAVDPLFDMVDKLEAEVAELEQAAKDDYNRYEDSIVKLEAELEKESFYARKQKALRVDALAENEHLKACAELVNDISDYNNRSI